MDATAREPISSKSVMADAGSSGWLFEYADGNDMLRMTYLDFPGEWVYEVQSEVVGGKPELVALYIGPRDAENLAPLRRADLRQVPLATLTDRVKATLRAERSRRVAMAAGGVRKPARQGRSWPPEHYLQVAWHYNHAQIVGNPPRKTVSAEWGVSEVTASRWIAQARRLGFLAEYDAGAGRSGRPSNAPLLDATESVRRLIVADVLRELVGDADPRVRQAAAVLVRHLFHDHETASAD